MSTSTINQPQPAADNKPTSQSEDDNNNSTDLKHQCQFCQGRFKSRNALFKHLRTTASCFERASKASGNKGATFDANRGIKLPKQKVVIRFGYHALPKTQRDDAAPSPSELAAQLVQQTFFEVLPKHHPIYQPSSTESLDDRMTQTTAAKHRHLCLAQDEDCSAASDYIGVYYQGEFLEDFQAVLKDMQTQVTKEITEKHSDSLRTVQLLDARVIPLNANFAAEKSCTQRVYHYLLPLDWLEGGDAARAWWLEQGGKEQFAAVRARDHQHRPRTTQRRPEVLKRLKLALGTLESKHLVDCNKGLSEEHKKINQKEKHNKQGDKSTSKKRKTEAKEINNVSKKGDIPQEGYKPSGTATLPLPTMMGASPGRFGNLWVKERRCWHNYADPDLRGMASPSNDPVWRTVDRAKVLKITGGNGDDNKMMAVVEIRGDGFVKQQIRRMIGSVIAMTNGWLPLDYTETATRSDICLETPLAPSGRTYFAGGRFHFLELVLHSPSTKELFKEREPISEAWQENLQSNLIEETRANETEWLQDLQQTITPRIKSQMAQIAHEDKLRMERATVITSKTPLSLSSDHIFTPTPTVYKNTIGLLRKIVSEETWPRTSKARSRVIRSVDQSSNKQVDYSIQHGSAEFDGERFQCGSFTVVNEDLVSGNLPFANELFPELAKAVFELEGELARRSPVAADGVHASDGVRPVSTHCAVNRNAQFVPHVDSGRGAGQSLSMIAGLGDYKGGEIHVEGQAYDIRYVALEFDGWKQRHWTAPFDGERYSLVWFTPAGNETNVKHETDFVEYSAEDRMARQLVAEHQKQLPGFPILMFRSDSTDPLVIVEIFDSEKGCTYELKHQIWEGNDQPEDFSLKGHACVLDIGAHIGVFSRFALAAGCKKVIVYEPEPSNLELLVRNLKSTDDSVDIIIHEAAVAHGATGHAQLVHARARNDGSKNTWRHALEEYSQYIDKTIKLSSAKQEGKLTRTTVTAVPFFGGALEAGVTFVKLDCEGAEIDILLADEAMDAKSWMDVTHLVFEWSFTKEKRLIKFHKVISNLKQAGFRVAYDGQGAWWDKEDSQAMWTFHHDLVVFARRQL